MGSMDIRDHLHDSMRKEAIFHDQSRPTTGSYEGEHDNADLDRQLQWLDVSDGDLLAGFGDTVVARESQAGKSRVSVLSYNVLARCHAESMHGRSKASVLTWSFRRQRLAAEIGRRGCDLVCLQDVDDYDWWRPQLSGLGYDTMYERRRASWSGGGRAPDDDDVDGVLVGWRRSSFQLVHSAVVRFHEAAGIAKTPALAVKASARDDVGLLVNVIPFNDTTLTSALVVGSFQLAGGHAGDAYEANPDDEDEISDRRSDALRKNWSDEEAVRLLQTRYLVKCVERFNSDFQHPVVLGGTMHATPGSDAYELMHNGVLPSVPRPPVPPPPPGVRGDFLGIGAGSASPTSAEVSWEPAFVNTERLDPPVESYRVSFRVGGSRTLGWSEPLVVSEQDCTHYKTTVRPGTSLRRTVRDPLYRTIVAGLASGVAYEFRVAGESSMGVGAWSAPSAPFATQTYTKEIRRPAEPPPPSESESEATAADGASQASRLSRADSIAESGVYLEASNEGEGDDDESSSSEDDDDLERDKAADVEDRRQAALCGAAPRLLLTCKEVLRQRAVGEDLSLPYAVAVVHERGLVDKKALEATRRVKGELGAVRELELLEAMRAKIEEGGIDPRLASRDPEVRLQARLATDERAIAAARQADNDARRHPYYSATGISPRHNGKFTGAANARKGNDGQVTVRATRSEEEQWDAKRPQEHRRRGAVGREVSIRSAAKGAVARITERLNLDRYFEGDVPEDNRVGVASAYALAGGDPHYTITAERRTACVDYIFTSRHVLTPVAVLPVPALRIPKAIEVDSRPQTAASKGTSASGVSSYASYDDDDDDGTESELKSLGTEDAETKWKEPGTWLPNSLFPSDHMALVCVFDVDETLTPAVHAS